MGNSYKSSDDNNVYKSAVSQKGLYKDIWNEVEGHL